MEEKKKQVVSSDNEEPIKTKKKKSIWKELGKAALSLGALAVTIWKANDKNNKNKGI